MAEHISIGDISPRVQYSGTGSQVTFTYPFPIFEDANMTVYVDAALQVSGYTVTGAGNDNGGSVIFDTAPAIGADITLVREVTVERTSDFQESGEFRAKVINDELDKIIAMLQELADDLSRTPVLATTDAAVDLTLPDKASRAGRFFGWDTDGKPIAAAGSTDGVVVSAFMAAVLEKPDAANALSTLGAEAADADILKADTSDTLSAGMLCTSHDLGNLNSATILHIADGNIQHGTMTGPFTLTAPDDPNDGYLELELIVDATGGHALTLSGFNEINGSFDNSADAVNLLRISKLNAHTYMEIHQAA